MKESDLPTHIGGYQHISHGPIQDGDIWVVDGVPAYAVHESWFKQPAQDVAQFRLYRKVPVAKQGGQKFNE